MPNRSTSEFAIALPLVPFPAAAHRQRCCVLVADDEPDIRELIVMIFEEQGCLVTAVEDGAAAIRAAEVTDFALVFLDVSMPVIDGLMAAAMVRKASPGIRIVLHTAMEEAWVRRRFTDYDAYFRKPLDIAGFERQLCDWIGGPAPRQAS